MNFPSHPASVLFIFVLLYRLQLTWIRCVGSRRFNSFRCIPSKVLHAAHTSYQFSVKCYWLFCLFVKFIHMNNFFLLLHKQVEWKSSHLWCIAWHFPTSRILSFSFSSSMLIKLKFSRSEMCLVDTKGNYFQNVYRCVVASKVFYFMRMFCCCILFFVIILVESQFVRISFWIWTTARKKNLAGFFLLLFICNSLFQFSSFGALFFLLCSSSYYQKS